MISEKVIIKQTTNKVIVSTRGVQGPRGRTILNGVGSPANNLGLTGDFYYDTITTRFYGPKLNDLSWVGAESYLLNNPAGDYSFKFSWELAEISGPVLGVYSVTINHNLGFHPNVTVQDSAGDVWETGLQFNNENQVTLTMANAFSGTAYLS